MKTPLARIDTVYAYYLVQAGIAAALIVRADQSVSVSTLLALGCSKRNFVVARAEMREEAETRREAGISDWRARLYACETLDELLTVRDQFADACSALLVAKEISKALSCISLATDRAS